MTKEDVLALFREKLGSLTMTGEATGLVKPDHYPKILQTLASDPLLGVCTMVWGPTDGEEPRLPGVNEEIEILEGSNAARASKVSRPCQTYRFGLAFPLPVAEEFCNGAPEVMLEYSMLHVRRDLSELVLLGQYGTDKQNIFLDTQPGILAQIPEQRHMQVDDPNPLAWIGFLEGLIKSSYTGDTPVMLRFLCHESMWNEGKPAVQGHSIFLQPLMPKNVAVLCETRAIILYLQGLSIDDVDFHDYEGASYNTDGSIKSKDPTCIRVEMQVCAIVHLINNAELFASAEVKEATQETKE